MTEETKALLAGVLSGDRVSLARAITLIESTRADHNLQATLLLDEVLEERAARERRAMVESQRVQNNSAGEDAVSLPPPPPAPRSFRIGLAGAPGAGKSSLIEAIGMHLTNLHKTKLAEGALKGSNDPDVFPNRPLKVAVIAVDPSSSRCGGSILGDKTRMTELTRQPNAFVRPSPTRGALGGVAQHTNDVALLCEGAGYDVVIVETVGLGQSEVTIDSTVDMTLLVVGPAGQFEEREGEDRKKGGRGRAEGMTPAFIPV